MYLGFLIPVLSGVSPAFAQPNPQADFAPKKILCPEGSTLLRCMDEYDGPDTNRFGSTGRERVIVSFPDRQLTVTDEGRGIAVVTEADGAECARIEIAGDYVTVTVVDQNRDGLLDLLFETDRGELWTLLQVETDDDVRD